MPLTEDQQKEVLTAELGAVGDSAFAAQLALKWTEYDDQPKFDPRLRPLLVKRDMILYLLGNAVQNRDWTANDGSAESDSQVFDHLNALLEDVIKVLATLRAGGGAVGPITRQAPIERADVVKTPIEPSDRMYRGDPLRRSVRA